MKKTAIFLIFILFAEVTSAQKNETEIMKNWELKGYAKSAERYNDKYSALKYYSELYKRKNNDFEIAYKVANLFFDINDFEKAKPIFYQLYKKNKRAYPKAVFKYGQILKNEGKFDSAVSCFNIYRDELLWFDNKSERNINLLKVDREIKGCENTDISFAKNNKNQKVNIFCLNKTVNTAYKDASPVIWDDTSFIYTSCLIDSMPVVNINTRQDMPVEKYYSAVLKNKKWEGKKQPPKPFFNMNNMSVSGGALSNNRKRFYFSAGYQDIYGKIYSSIYVSRKINGIWSKPEKLNNQINLKNYMSAQPTIGKCYNDNFDVIYFVSDRPGGYGGSDIWYTIYDKITGEYKSPVNAGPYINSPGNEITPKTDNSLKILYFSSDNHSGYGGFDIYKTFGELVNWTKPENIGKPLNSAYDDFWFTYFQNDSTGLFVSNRNKNNYISYEHCCYDIFEYRFVNKKPIILTDTIFETDDNFYNKLIQNKSDSSECKKESSNTIVKLHIKNNDDGNYVYLTSDTTDNRGIFEFKIAENQKYMLTVEKKNYTPTSLTFSTDHSINSKLRINPVVMIPKHKKAFTLNKIYFEFNKWNLTKESKMYIDTFLYQILKENKNLVIEIDAYTDCIGEFDYNLYLSKKRAESVVNYLTQKGIHKDRLIAKGFGEKKPVASEFTKTGEDNPSGRAKNRRVEFKVIGLFINNN